uniref:DUF4485 domain-containing protein n=1 Tax=Rhodnius prolixus TaxID=13249 RepID=A0A4P6DAJ1_RHOPR
MPNPYKILREAFEFNVLLVRALLHLVQQAERHTLALWMKKLTTQCDTPEEMSLRNEYVWYLLVMLQSGAIGTPFNKPPPGGRLQDLASVIPRNVYKEIMEMSLDSNEKSDEQIQLEAEDDEMKNK